MRFRYDRANVVDRSNDHVQFAQSLRVIGRVKKRLVFRFHHQRRPVKSGAANRAFHIVASAVRLDDMRRTRRAFLDDAADARRILFAALPIDEAQMFGGFAATVKARQAYDSTTFVANADERLQLFDYDESHRTDVGNANVNGASSSEMFHSRRERRFAVFASGVDRGNDEFAVAKRHRTNHDGIRRSGRRVATHTVDQRQFST